MPIGDMPFPCFHVELLINHDSQTSCMIRTTQSTPSFSRLGGVSDAPGFPHAEHGCSKTFLHIEITTKVKPKAVVVFSAHWQASKSDQIEVNTKEMTDLIYEYVSLCTLSFQEVQAPPMI